MLNLLDIDRGASLRAESTSVAVRVARELSDGMTQAERVATHEFLTEIAQAVRWPRFIVSAAVGSHGKVRVVSDRNRPKRTKRATVQSYSAGLKSHLSSGLNVYIPVAVGCG